MAPAPSAEPATTVPVPVAGRLATCRDQPAPSASASGNGDGRGVVACCTNPGPSWPRSDWSVLGLVTDPAGTFGLGLRCVSGCRAGGCEARCTGGEARSTISLRAIGALVGEGPDPENPDRSCWVQRNSRSVSTGPTAATSGERPTRNTSPCSRCSTPPGLVAGPAAEPPPSRTERGSPLAGTATRARPDARGCRLPWPYAGRSPSQSAPGSGSELADQCLHAASKAGDGCATGSRETGIGLNAAGVRAGP